jgi:hypothetical protein
MAARPQDPPPPPAISTQPSTKNTATAGNVVIGANCRALASGAGFSPSEADRFEYPIQFTGITYENREGCFSLCGRAYCDGFCNFMGDYDDDSEIPCCRYSFLECMGPLCAAAYICCACCLTWPFTSLYYIFKSHCCILNWENDRAGLTCSHCTRSAQAHRCRVQSLPPAD